MSTFHYPLKLSKSAVGKAVILTPSEGIFKYFTDFHVLCHSRLNSSYPSANFLK